MSGDVSERRFDWSGIVLVLALLIVLVVLFTDRPPDTRQIHRYVCLNNLKQLGTAMHMYEMDYGGLPVLLTTAQRAKPGESWPDAITPYIKNLKIFGCPRRHTSEGELSYSFSRRLSGLRVKDVTADTADIALIFDSVTDSPANNNLNGDRVWREGDSTYPRIGQFVRWPSDRERYYREWPDWAKPRHEGKNMVVFLDGHVKSCRLDGEPLFDPKEEPVVR